MQYPNKVESGKWKVRQKLERRAPGAMPSRGQKIRGEASALVRAGGGTPAPMNKGFHYEASHRDGARGGRACCCDLGTGGARGSRRPRAERNRGSSQNGRRQAGPFRHVG